MSLWDAVLGRPLASSEKDKEALSVLTGVPVLGLDALASTGYGPEVALTVLVTVGAIGLRYFPFIAAAVVLNCPPSIDHHQHPMVPTRPLGQRGQRALNCYAGPARL